MSDHIRLGGSIDPMDSMFTSNHTVDLTRNTKAPEESVGLGVLGATPAPHNADNFTPKSDLSADIRKPKGEVIHAKMSDNVQVFDPTTLIPKTEKKDEGANEVYTALDIAIQREKESITARHEALKEKMYEDYLEAESEKEFEVESNTSVTSNSSATASKLINEDEDDDDLYGYGSDEIAKKYSVPEEARFKSKFDTEVRDIEEEKPTTISIKKTVHDEFEIDEDELNEDLDDSEEKRAESIQKPRI